MTGCLGQDGFSLNRAARTLDAIVTDTLHFAESESRTAELPDWKDEARTAIALELAAARLLAHCATPVMPRFAARLSTGLGMEPPDQWPHLATLVTPGTQVNLARQVFFSLSGAPETQAEQEQSWLYGAVRDLLLLSGAVPVADATLTGLGVNSLQAIALQYEILERTGVDMTVDDLLGQHTVAELATLLGDSTGAAGSQLPEEVGR
jgi:methionyl-tRNA synthetase